MTSANFFRYKASPFPYAKPPLVNDSTGIGPCITHVVSLERETFLWFTWFMMCGIDISEYLTANLNYADKKNI
jgi:uncharacterized membrane protein (DUF106 family)